MALRPSLPVGGWEEEEGELTENAEHWGGQPCLCALQLSACLMLAATVSGEHSCHHSLLGMRKLRQRKLKGYVTRLSVLTLGLRLVSSNYSLGMSCRDVGTSDLLGEGQWVWKVLAGVQPGQSDQSLDLCTPSHPLTPLPGVRML